MKKMTESEPRIPTTRSIIAHSHCYGSASDCGLYLQLRVLELRKVSFTVKEDGNMWKLIFHADLDRIHGHIDTGWTHTIVDQARAFITGRGGMAMPRIPLLGGRSGE